MTITRKSNLYIETVEKLPKFWHYMCEYTIKSFIKTLIWYHHKDIRSNILGMQVHKKI